MPLLEAFSMGEVIVTWVSIMRGRFTDGFYQKMNMPTHLVRFYEEMQSTVLDLWKHPERCASLAKHVAAQQHRLFHDLDTIHEWNMLLNTIQPIQVNASRQSNQGV